jgi:IS30 family transposase
MKDLRPAIIRAHEKGKGVREIARFLDIEPSTVSRAIKRFEETVATKTGKETAKNQQEAEEMFSAPKE